MSFTSNRSQFFSVVGAAYVAESRGGRTGHFPTPEDFERVRTGVTGLWLSFFAVIAISLINNCQTAKALQFASNALH